MGLVLVGVDGVGADFLLEVVVGPPLPRGPALHRARDDHRALREEEALLELPAGQALHPRDLERAFDVVEHGASSNGGDIPGLGCLYRTRSMVYHISQSFNMQESSSNDCRYGRTRVPPGDRALPLRRSRAVGHLDGDRMTSTAMTPEAGRGPARGERLADVVNNRSCVQQPPTVSVVMTAWLDRSHLRFASCDSQSRRRREPSLRGSGNRADVGVRCAGRRSTPCSRRGPRFVGANKSARAG